jgi:hypothetical protein
MLYQPRGYSHDIRTADRSVVRNCDLIEALELENLLPRGGSRLRAGRGHLQRADLLYSCSHQRNC